MSGRTESGRVEMGSVVGVSVSYPEPEDLQGVASDNGRRRVMKANCFQFVFGLTVIVSTESGRSRWMTDPLFGRFGQNKKCRRLC